MKALEKDRAKRYGSCAELKAEVASILAALPEGAAPAPPPPEDMERTVATPTNGYSTGASPRSARVLDTPIAPATAARPTRGGAADVHLRTAGVALETSPETSDKGPALRVFLSAAIVLLAGGGAFYLYTQRKAERPRPVPPPATEVAAAPAPAASTAAPNPPPEVAASATSPVPSTAASAPTAGAPATGNAPPASAAEPPVPAVKEAGPVNVTFRSNQVGILTLAGKRHGPVAPSGTRASLRPGSHVAVFEIPGYMKITKAFEVAGPDTKPVTVEFPPRGIVTITVSPAGADIKIDGVSVGASTGAPLRKTLRSGTHEIVASLPGYVTGMRTVELSEEDSQVVRIDLKKE